jgi:hypothetical protein
MIRFLDAQPERWIGVYLIVGALLVLAVMWLLEKWDGASRNIDRSLHCTDPYCRVCRIRVRVR